VSSSAATQFAATRLQAVLRLLALEPEQIDVAAASRLGSMGTLANDFDEFHTVAVARFGAAMTTDQKARLADVAARIAVVRGSRNRDLWTLRAVRCDAAWAAVRDTAKAALAEFGWTALPSDPREWPLRVRAKWSVRQGLWFGPGALALTIVWTYWLGPKLLEPWFGVHSPHDDDNFPAANSCCLALLPLLVSQIASLAALIDTGVAWRTRRRPLALWSLAAYWVLLVLLVLLGSYLVSRLLVR
jgi:hypothetical protein